MKYFSFIIFFLFSTFLSMPAQNEYRLNMEMTVNSDDKLNSLTLYNSGGLEEVIEGYVLLPEFLDKVEGAIKPGGFDILDSKINSTILDSKKQRENLTKNKFPGGDLEVMANGLDVSEILTFRLMPEFVDENDDSLTLFFKYAVYE